VSPPCHAPRSPSPRARNCWRNARKPAQLCTSDGTRSETRSDRRSWCGAACACGSPYACLAMPPLPHLLPAAPLAVVLRRSRLRPAWLSGLSCAVAHERPRAGHSSRPAIVIGLCGPRNAHRFSHTFGSICIVKEIANHPKVLRYCNLACAIRLFICGTLGKTVRSLLDPNLGPPADLIGPRSMPCTRFESSRSLLHWG
jgi:hypothetical protein